MSADEWEQEMISERVEQERQKSIEAYNRSKQSSALSEDYVDTTPIPVKEAEPTYISAPVQRAKKSVVTTKKRIKKSVKNHTR
jgi:DNA-binding SARP family transcriptional activator